MSAPVWAECERMARAVPDLDARLVELRTLHRDELAVLLVGVRNMTLQLALTYQMLERALLGQTVEPAWNVDGFGRFELEDVGVESHVRLPPAPVFR